MMSDYQAFRQDLCRLYLGDMIKHTGKDWFAIFLPFADNINDRITLELHVDHKRHQILITDSGYTKFNWTGIITDKEFADAVTKGVFGYHLYGEQKRIKSDTRSDEIFITTEYKYFMDNLCTFVQCLLGIYAICDYKFECDYERMIRIDKD